MLELSIHLTRLSDRACYESDNSIILLDKHRYLCQKKKSIIIDAIQNVLSVCLKQEIYCVDFRRSGKVTKSLTHPNTQSENRNNLISKR
ncbi:unnamed protein product [Arctia plantaginis]|uniref:Uncharacterized protein n=1 Tax=Arctia plantaginis TaxID=874455 RepID=A0A8S1A9U9_ARCPL|nr:unnamed protein product [Arctia plantaginis]